MEQDKKSEVPDVLTLTEAAAFLRVHINTLAAQCNKGTVPHARMGAKYQFSRAALVRFLSGEKTGG